MKLPVIDLPLFYTELPSTNEKIAYRAYTVKEEKIMLIAKESKDPLQIVMAIKQVLTNCIPNKNIDELSVFDVEYMQTMIRSKSVNNTIDFTIRDPETFDEVKLSLDIEDIKIVRDPLHSNKIKINEQYTLLMKYPNFDAYVETFRPGVEKDPLAYYGVMISCLDRLVSQDTVYTFSEFTGEEIDSFVESLETAVIDNIRKFFDTMPKLRHEIPYVNSAGVQKTFVLEGTESFFI